MADRQQVEARVNEAQAWGEDIPQLGFDLFPKQLTAERKHKMLAPKIRHGKRYAKRLESGDAQAIEQWLEAIESGEL